MIVLGLTGSIGMGKSATLDLFREEGAACWDSDSAVHRLYGPGGGAVAAVGAAFPGVTNERGVDRPALAKRVAGAPEALKRLESIVHPLVAADRQAFLASRPQAPLVVFDIPLLFEARRENEVDAIVVVTAAHEVQRERVMARPGMTFEKFEALLARQLPDHEKRARADFVIKTDQGFDAARKDVRRIIATVTAPGWRPARRA